MTTAAPAVRDAEAPIVPAGVLPAGLGEATGGALEDLRRRGVRPGERLVLDADPGSRWDVLATLLAADRLGAASLVADPGWSRRERAAVLADVGPHRVVAAAAGTGEPAGTATGPGPFLLPTTSGSTGTPTVLARTRDSWRLGFDVLGPLPGPILVPGPPSSTLYLFGALHALHHGRELVTAERFVPADAGDAGTVHLVPAQLTALLEHHERHRGPGPRTVVCGGAHVAPAVRERCARLLPDTRLVEYYGSAEHSLIALGGDDGRLRPVDGVTVELRDGILVVDSPQTALGRLRGGVLVPFPPGPTTVGDRGGIDDDGALTVLGRSSATLSTGGTLVAAEEVEQVLRAVPGVTDAVVAGTPHPSLGMLVTAVVEGHPDRRALRTACRETLSAAKHPRRWLAVDALPRLGSGKPARAAVAEGLRDGTLGARPLGSRP